MGFLSDIGGMLPTAYAGFNKGVDDMKARQQRDTDLQYQEEQRASERSMAPAEDELRKKRLAAAGIKLDNEMELAPGQQERAREEARHLANIDPLRRSIEEWNAIRESSDRKQKFIEMAVPKLGESIQANDQAGVSVGVKNLFDAGLFKDVDGLQGASAVKSELTDAPEGAVDFRGQPVKGRAIRTTLNDGRQGYIGTDYMLAQYAKQIQAADADSVKMIKPGERAFVPRTGQVIAEGQPRITSQGYYDPETGEFVPARPGASGASGSRSGAGGRAAASPEAAAASAFENIYKNSEVKLQAAQIADGQAYTVRAMKQGAETPEDAARIGLDAAANPSKIVPDIDAKTGAWSGVYRNPSIQGGKPFNLAPNFTSTQEVAKREDGALVLKDAAGKLLDAQGAIIAPGNPQAQSAIREQFMKAANDPAERARMLEIAGRGGPQEVDALTRKLDLIKAYGPKLPPVEKPGNRSRLNGVGGLGGAERYMAPADSPAGRAQARQAEARAKSDAAAQQKVTAQQELSTQFRSDMKSMEPLELARKYDAMRGRMTTEDAAALQQVERNIR